MDDAFAKVAALAKKRARRDEMEKAREDNWDFKSSVDEGEWQKRHWKKKEEKKEDKEVEEKIKNPILKVPSFGSLAPRVPSPAAPVLSAVVPVLSSATRVPFSAPQPEAKPKITLKLGPNAKKALSRKPSEDVDEDSMVMDEDRNARMREAPPLAWSI